MTGPIRLALENVRYLQNRGAKALVDGANQANDDANAHAIACALNAIAAGLSGVLERLAADEDNEPARPWVVHDPDAGRRAYEAYCHSVGGRDFRGYELLPWDELAEHRRAAWFAAATWYEQ